MPEIDGGIDGGSQSSSSMSVQWKANPELPGKVSDKLIVSAATFQVNHFQIVADSGSVMHSRYLLAWDSSGGPAKEEFDDAPAGVYSKATLDLGGSLVAYAYQISGTWTEDGKEPKPFVIEDADSLSLSVDCNTTLSAPGSGEIEIKVDLSDPLGMISFKDIDDEDGPIMVTAQMNMPSLLLFRTRLPHAFHSDN
ncbi:MAG TPA: hypothetical protein VFT22_25855 [Kofleriaceae bacterium]|nr:hypothetical protein [Kofleriaceae bacterium]